jgi:hypothetical protein
MTDTEHPPWDPYKRVRLFDGVPLIRSTCVYCGHVIEGSVVNKVLAQEVRHFTECAERKKKVTVAGGR